MMMTVMMMMKLVMTMMMIMMMILQCGRGSLGGGLAPGSCLTTECLLSTTPSAYRKPHP